jgi:hypothetical protein
VRTLTPREKRTLKIAAVLLGVYLLLFYGSEGVRYLEGKRAEASHLRQRIGRLQLQMQRQESKRRSLTELRRSLGVDVENLDGGDVAAKALASIQETAKTCSVPLGPIKEMEGNPAAGELSRFQLEARGPVKALIGFLHSLYATGYPLTFDQLTWTRQSKKPGNVELSFYVTVLDYAAGKSLEAQSVAE